ncbi:lactoylglutathione lyase family protein [Streptomyces sp. NPDC003077]|uniref:lactoylglutathione lyase family protein n=1 Tax=Streptomyces sp. NPDC003077 TaxID=3154443 RepID=UPI0033B3AB35
MPDGHTYPRAFCHVGISVPDLDRAVDFYTTALGWYVIKPPTRLEEDDSPVAVMCTDAFGSGWQHLRIAHLSTGDGIGFEMFEFRDNVTPDNLLEYWKTGIFHFCVQDPDVEGLAERIIAAGGRQTMPVRHYYPGEKPYRMVYCADPFGNPIEIYSHGYELTYSVGAYE